MPKIEITENSDKFITSPKGELLYTVVTGEGKIDYNGTGREFCSTLKLSKKEGKEFFKELCEVFDEYKPKWAKDIDEPTNKLVRKDDEGNYLFNFATHTSFDKVDTETNQTITVPIRIGLINSKNKEVVLPEGEGIGNGSLGRISGSIFMHETAKEKKCSLSLTLSKIQIAKYVKYVATTGFEEDEDGDFDGFGGADGDFPDEQVEQPKKKKKGKKKKKNKGVSDE